MSLWQNIGGTWRKGTLWQNVRGTWRKVVVYQNVRDVWKKDTAVGPGGNNALSASLSQDNAYGATSKPNPSRVRTNDVTVTGAGGSGAYAYSWAAQSDWMITAPNSATTSFSAIVSPGDDVTTEFLCTVTDGTGASVSVTVAAGVANYYSGGGGGIIV